jgi:undecaprenyl-diphosphatase
MDVLQSIILGLTQGVTEWLPVSSTGHLRIAERAMNLQVPLIFDVTLHLATLLVVLVYFRTDVKNILISLGRGDFKSENGKLIPLIILGTIPAAVIGVVLGDALDTNFNSILSLGAGFLVSGVVLFASRFSHERRDDITYVDALLIGVAQVIALVPSISRSGMTISVALLLGLSRKKAFKFSFLLFIPAEIGAEAITLYQQRAGFELLGIGITEIVAGCAAAIVVSFLVLRLLWKIIDNKKFYLFAFYCFALGAALVALSLSGF